MRTIEAVCDWVGLVDSAAGDGPRRLARSSFLQVIGELALVHQIVAIPSEHYLTASAAWKVKVEHQGQANDVDPTPVERGHPGIIRRVARLLMKLNPDELAPSGQGGSSGPPVNADLFGGLLNSVQAAAPRTVKKILASKVLPQNDDSEVVPMDATVLAQLIED